nr:glycoside hydrolase family 25 protein [Heyndrickxia coagulans]
MSHICVVGTTQSGWIYTSHFTKPAPAAGGTTSTTTGTSQTGSSTAGGKTTGTATGSTSGSTGSAAATSGTTTTGNTGSGSASGTTTTGSTGSATASATTTKGLDVSHYQTLTQDSFNLMKSQGYNFVILKATEGSGYTDSKFYTYYKYARNAGLSVHAYHMIGNSTTTSAQHIAEAKHFYQVLAQTKAKTGYAFTGYAFEDIEPTGTNSITTTWWANAAPACAGYFLNEMQTLGQTKVGIYAGYFNWKSYLEGHTDSWPSNTKIWLARYNITLGTNADVWQYTETGTIDGITGHFDLDISYDPDF